MKVLVTGAGGFVGSYLLPELRKAGHEVVGLDLHPGEYISYICDLVEGNKLEEIVQKTGPDAVVHLAAIANVDFENPDLMYKINLLGTINLLKAVSKLHTKPHFLFISSSQVYGEVEIKNLPITEMTQLAPVNHYGASKAACENAVRAFALTSHFPYIIARPFNHTGPGQSTNFVIPKIVEHFRKKADLIELGNTWPLRDFLDVRDVVRAYRLMIESEQSNLVYNIARGKSYSIEHVVQILCSITGHSIKVVHMQKFMRDNEIPEVLGAHTLLKETLGWEPVYSLEDTLAEMLNT